MRKRLLLAITAFLLACTLVNAETLEERVDRLEKELRETKEELQKQIAEKQVPAPVVAAAPALDISKLTDGFEFHGYGRAGVLINQDGDKGNAFKVQDEGFAQKYRLGNEDDTYAELELVKKFDVNGAKGSVHYMFSTKSGSGDEYKTWTSGSSTNPGSENDSFKTRQFYVDITPNDGATYWAGKRYYAREDIHINDYYIRNYSGTGAGIQNIKLGSGAADVALIANDPSDHPEYTLHSRYSVGPWAFELAGHTMKSDSTDKDITEWGTQGSVSYSLPGFYGLKDKGSSKVVLQGGVGLGSGSGLGSATAWGDTRKDAYSINLVTYGQANLSDRWQIMPELGYRYDKNFGGKKDQKQQWVTTGIRVVNPITQHFAMQYETGLDYVKVNKGNTNYDSGLFKLTVAPTLKLDTENFWGRPEIRAFVTYGHGFGDKKFIRVDSDGKEHNKGVQFGIQTEVWF